MKAVSALSDTKKLQLDFWQAFNEYAFNKPDFKKVFSKRKAQPQHWYDLSVGSSAYHIALTANTQKKRIGAEIYINDDKDLFEKFKSQKNVIEADLGIELEWRTATKACRILALNKGDIKQAENTWPRYFDWFCEMALKLREIIGIYGG